MNYHKKVKSMRDKLHYQMVRRTKAKLKMEFPMVKELSIIKLETSILDSFAKGISKVLALTSITMELFTKGNLRRATLVEEAK
jgi:hypothetical protein